MKVRFQRGRRALFGMMELTKRARASLEPHTACFHCCVISFVYVAFILFAPSVFVAFDVYTLHRSPSAHIGGITYRITYFVPRVAHQGRQRGR